MPAQSRNLVGEIMRRVATVKNAVIADAIGHDESHVSRVMSGERGLRIEEIEPFFKSIGLVVIEAHGEMRSISADEHDALKLLARKGLDR